ncbi:MAG: hypothetical protein K6T57_14215 [Thermaceae bacterium]|nr:hypothetical protein [Thermaceae bacterium]
MLTRLNPRPILIATAFLGLALAQPLPAKAPPQGMRSLDTGGQGRILYTTLSGSRSATKLAQAVRIGIQGYFDAEPSFQAGVRDPGDTQFQAAFSARLRGVAVVGLLAVTVNGSSGGTAVLMFDSQGRARQSFPAMIRALQGGGGSAPVAPLTRTPLPDGSGSIGLAPGWQITGAYQGTVDVVGPGGASMSLGGPHIVVPAQAAALFPGYPVVSSSNPTQALVEITRQSGAQMQVIDSRPVEWQNGQAAFVRYRGSAGGRTVEGFALAALMPYDTNALLFYLSYIAAPPQVFPQIFPTALQMWGSWSINPAVFTQRLMAAAQSMRETSEIITRSYNDRSRAYDSINKGWSQYIRDTATLEYVDGRRAEDVSANFANWLVREDPVNWRIVPASELIPR